MARGSGLTGKFWVRVLKAALLDAKKTWPKHGDRMRLRRQALKLRYFPGLSKDGGDVLDVNWEWIKALSQLSIGELRITDRIGGHTNIRVIFYVHERKDKKRQSNPEIWILACFPKKRQNFTVHDLKTLKARRTAVLMNA